ncbi:AT-hook motif nuclear-localized protein 14-like isoform X2 [Tasmannia lanceolata]|uniref:AT-hook motif nuclear-localized protein 14-like isoform X2 n=1 Tax=Tasmannia lanceolata TaxID=3420 RepID=UPI0040628F07
MEGNEGDLSSYYHHHHHQQQHQQNHHTTTTNGLFSNPNPNTHYSDDQNPLLFPPNSVSIRPSAVPPVTETIRRKRGRPRKYGPGGTNDASSSSASASPSTNKAPTSAPPSSLKKESSSSSKKAQLDALGNAGQGFTPHVITVAAGELGHTLKPHQIETPEEYFFFLNDVCLKFLGMFLGRVWTVCEACLIQSWCDDVGQKIMSFMQQLKRAICILSASGSISNASLRQPAMLGGNVTYEGRFEILSLSGSFIRTEVGGGSSITGGLSICLSGADGRIVGGGVGGPLKAAGPVQVIAGSFVVDPKKDFSGAANIESSAPVIGQTVSAVGFRSAPDSSTRISARVNDSHQNTGGSGFMLQSRAMHVMPSRSTDWRGGHIDPDSRSDVDI